MWKYIAVIIFGLICTTGFSAEFHIGGGIHLGEHTHPAPCPPAHHSYQHVRPSWVLGFRPMVVIENHYGHYETRTEQFLVRDAWTERTWMDAIYSYKKDKDGNCILDENGKRILVLVAEGYWKEIYHPAEYQERTITVWIRD